MFANIGRGKLRGNLYGNIKQSYGDVFLFTANDGENWFYASISESPQDVSADRAYEHWCTAHDAAKEYYERIKK